MRFAFLMNGLSGYFATCLEVLAQEPDTQVLVLTKELPPNADFEPEHVTPEGVALRTYPAVPTGPSLLSEVRAFQPDVLAIVGWQVTPYRYVARHLRPRPLRVLLMD